MTIDTANDLFASFSKLIQPLCCGFLRARLWWWLLAQFAFVPDAAQIISQNLELVDGHLGITHLLCAELGVITTKLNWSCCDLFSQSSHRSHCFQQSVHWILALTLGSAGVETCAPCLGLCAQTLCRCMCNTHYDTIVLGSNHTWEL